MAAARLLFTMNAMANAQHCVAFDTAASNVWYEANPPFYGNQSSRLRQDYTLTREDGELIHKHQLAGALSCPAEDQKCVKRQIQSCSTEQKWCFLDDARPESLEEIKAIGVLPAWVEEVIGIAFDEDIFQSYGTSDTKLKVCGKEAQSILWLVQTRLAFRLVRPESDHVDLNLKVPIKRAIAKSGTRSADYMRLSYRNGVPNV